MKTNISYMFGWNRVMILLLLLLSFSTSYKTYQLILVDSVTELFGLLGLLPFAAIGFVLHLMSVSTRIIKSGRGLSRDECRRMSRTLERRRDIYIKVSLINLAFGLASILYYMFFGLDQFFIFIFASAVYLSAGSVLVCIFEESDLSKVSKTIEIRKARREAREGLQREKERARSALNGGSSA